jgi:hypothetical protein
MRAAPQIHIPNPLHVNIVGAFMSGVARALSGGVQSLGSWAFDHMTNALVATTQVQLGGWFDGPWRAMLTVAGVFALPILLAGVATEVLAGRPGQALRRGVLMPLAVAPALLAARAVLGLVLAVVNGACGLVVQIGIGGPGGFAQALTRMGLTLGVSASPIAPQTGGAIGPLIVVLIAAVLAFVIWVELACRAALVLILVAFVPLAFAGLFWHSTATWTRRLLEVLAAVILAQLVITVLMVLAAAAMASPGRGLATGIDGIAVGLALLFLGSLGLPMTFRVLPHVVEAAAVAGSGAAVARRMHHGAGQLVAAAPSPVTRLAAGSAGSASVGRPAVGGGPAMRSVSPSASKGGSAGSPPPLRSGPATPSRSPARPAMTVRGGGSR